MYVLGISALYHDSAACIIHNGEIVAAAQEERFTRKKHDSSFPKHAIKFCLEFAQITLDQVDHVAYYEKPLLKFERVLENFLHIAPKGVVGFVKYMPSWIKQKVFFRKFLDNELKELKLGSTKGLEVKFVEHHLSHAAWSYYTSPFDSAAILTIDGVGEWTTTAIYNAQAEEISILEEQHYPHSIGLFYSSFTQFLGFKVNDGEYKMMGLAPYGNRKSEYYIQAKNVIVNKLVELYIDGSIRLNLKYFSFLRGNRMIVDERWESVLGLPPRKEEEELIQAHCDIALAAQDFTEEVLLRTLEHIKEVTNENNICLSGGVAYNCVANGKLIESTLFDNIHIPPAVGDAGSAVGAALFTYFALNPDHKKNSNELKNQISFLGPEYSKNQIKNFLKASSFIFQELNENLIIEETCLALETGKVVGWFQGRMEFGARALGARSILANPTIEKIQAQINLKIKFRESFRPFAVILLEEDLKEYFELGQRSPYMAIVTQILKEYRNELPSDFVNYSVIEKCNFINSKFPGITHVDYSSRIQTVDEDTNPRLFKLLSLFKRRTGHSLLINTSFNLNKEPIVCSPYDALKCYQETDMDAMAIGDFWLGKNRKDELED